jgi:hypothetical protein
MTGITTYLSVLTLNVNELNSPIKKHHLMNWIKKEDPTERSIGLGKRLSQWPPKTGRSSNTYL